MLDEEIREGLRLLIKVWEQGGKEAVEALLERQEPNPRRKKMKIKDENGQIHTLGGVKWK